MGLEVVMRQQVGDGKASEEAVGGITCEADNWASNLSINVTVPNDTETPDSYTKDDFSDPSGDDTALATELKAFLDTISALAVTQTNEVLDLASVDKGRAGNDIEITTNIPTAFVITEMDNGRDENEAVEMELTLEDDDDLILKVDGDVIFKTPFKEDSFENEEPFERNLTHWLKKTRC